VGTRGNSTKILINFILANVDNIWQSKVYT